MIKTTTTAVEAAAAVCRSLADFVAVIRMATIIFLRIFGRQNILRRIRGWPVSDGLSANFYRLRVKLKLMKNIFRTKLGCTIYRLNPISCGLTPSCFLL